MTLWNQPTRDQWLSVLLPLLLLFSEAKAEVVNSENPRTEALNSRFSFIVLPRNAGLEYQYAKFCV
jgi:hypothetical protein